MSNVRSTTLYKIWSEWDIGTEDVVFYLESLAKKYAKDRYTEQFGENPEEPFEEIWGDLIGTDTVELYDEF